MAKNKTSNSKSKQNKTTKSYFIEAVVADVSEETGLIKFHVRGAENHLYREKNEDGEIEYNVFASAEKNPQNAIFRKMEEALSLPKGDAFNNLLILGAFFSNRKIRLETDGDFNVVKVSVGMGNF